MKPYWSLIAIVLVASLLRLFQLGSNPPSIDWDEASLGYNAYSILKTGNDEYGNRLPLSIRSFNDYKPPLYTYLTIPFVATLGLNELSVRLPSAIAGILAVIGTYYLTQQIFHHSSQKMTLSLTSSFLLALSPWHLQFSRAAFEANLALTCYIWAVAFFLAWINHPIKHPKLQNQNTYLLIFSVITATASLYSYHSARLVIPLMFICLGLIYWKIIINRKSQLLLALTLAVTLVLPLLYVTIKVGATQRFSTVSIFTNPGLFSREAERINRVAQFRLDDPLPLKILHQPQLAYAKIVARNHLEHFNFDFLFLTGDGNGRHAVSGMGLLYLIEFPFLIYGAYVFISDKKSHQLVILLWILLGPLAASLTAHTPHAIRSLLLLPSFQIITAYGAVTTYQKFNNTPYRVILFPSVILLFTINFLIYLNLYYVIYPRTSSQDWQYGYKQLVSKINQLEPDYDHIIITNKYDQPHIFFAFYNQIDPLYYQTIAEDAHQSFAKYVFTKIEFRSDIQTPNAIIVTQPEASPDDVEPIDQIKFLNGDVAFNIYSSN